jgi:hypothetical protein
MTVTPSRRRSRRWTGLRRSVLAIGLTIPLLAAPVPAGAEPDRPSAGAIPLNLHVDPKPSRTHIPDDQKPGAASNCETLLASAAEYTRQGQRVAGCAEPAAPAQKEIGVQSVWCEGAGQGWWVDRRAACHILTVQWTLYDLNTFDVLGQARFTIRQEIETFDDPATPYWSEDVSMTMDDAWGGATFGQLEFTERCSAPCRMTNTSAWGSQGISIGQTLDGTFENSDFPIPGPDRITLSYSARFTIPGAADVPFTTAAPLLRCDHVVAVLAGCVFPDHWPELRLPVSQYGEGALTVAFGNYAQWPGFGYRQPLSRLADEPLANNNRNVICRDGTFFPIFADDSCDEFAFARSYQSGAMNGVPAGIFCAEVWFEQVNGQWFWNAVRSINGTEICVRAHVPQSRNGPVGSALGGFTNAQRLLNGDPYWAYAT